MPFVTGEVEAREQAPWAYDPTNDVLKVGPLYMAAAGLTGSIQYGVNPLGTTAFHSTIADTGGFYLVPAGKILLLTDITASAHNGKVQVALQYDSNGTNVAVITPAGGGAVHKSFTTPVKFTAGQKIHFAVYNIDAVNTAPDLMCRAQFVVL